nr:myosin 2 essential light chain [Hymenolepis microstoma]
MADLPEKDFKDAREFFSLFATGDDEKIEARYIGDLVRALGLVPTEAQIAKFGFKDKPSERISFETFLPIYQGLLKDKKPTDPEEYVEGFKVFDKESNGFISAAELRHLLTQLGERLSEKEVDILLLGMEDSQGQVPYEAFVRRIMS